MYNYIFFTNVLQLLEELGITRSDLASRSGVSVSFLSELTNGKANPSLKTMEAIAEALETPLPMLLEVTDLDRETIEKVREEEERIRAELGLAKGVSLVPSLPDDYVRCTVILSAFQAFSVKKWDRENRQKIKISYKRIEKNDP